VNNPIYRWQTFGEHGMVFNALLFFDDLAERRTKNFSPSFFVLRSSLVI
jgi:hypothetical protein